MFNNKEEIFKELQIIIAPFTTTKTNEEGNNTYLTRKNIDLNLLKQNFINFLLHNLLNVKDIQEVDKHRRILSNYFHPDKISFFPEVAWLHEVFQDKCFCFSLLSSCADSASKMVLKLAEGLAIILQSNSQITHVLKRFDYHLKTLLLDPQHSEVYKSTLEIIFNASHIALIPEFQSLENMLAKKYQHRSCLSFLKECEEDIRKKTHVKNELLDVLEKLRNEATEPDELNFYKSCLRLLHASEDYSDIFKGIQNTYVTYMIDQIPKLCPYYVLGTFTTPLVYIYLLSGLSVALGSQLEGCQHPKLQSAGTNLVQIGTKSSVVTTTAIFRLFSLSYEGCTSGIQFVIKPRHEPAPSLTHHTFNTLELNQLAAPLKKYLKSNEQQFFRSYRTGEEKHRAVTAFFDDMIQLDNSKLRLDEKLSYLEKSLQLIVKDETLNRDKLGKSISDTLKIFSELTIKRICYDMFDSNLDIPYNAG